MQHQYGFYIISLPAFIIFSTSSMALVFLRSLSINDETGMPPQAGRETSQDSFTALARRQWGLKLGILPASDPTTRALNNCFVGRAYAK